MIVEYLEDGFITHVVFDPVPEGMQDVLAGLGKTFLDLPPTPLPDLPILDEQGEQVYRDEYEPLFNEDGSPQMGEDGTQLLQIIKIPAMETGRFEYAQVDITADYIVDGVPVKRPTFDLPTEYNLVRGEEFTIHNLPDPCDIWVKRQKYTIEGGSLTLEGEDTETYEVRLEAFPFITHTIKVTVA